jgi:plasmid stability protein
MPDGMRARIAAAAKRNHRSMNSEIIMILANALGDEGQPATGESLQATAPAAGHSKAALQGGSATHG